jgi:hypothetical protein
MFSWLRRNLRREIAVDPEHGPVMVQGIQLRCYVCSHDSFWAKRIQLDTPLMASLSLEAWDRVADCAICQKCGYIHWFLDPLALARALGDVDEQRVEGADPAV